MRRAHRTGIAIAAGAMVLLTVRASTAAGQDPYADAREQMVTLIASRGVRDSATLAALRTVPRHEFVPRDQRRRAYGDYPLPIGLGQTISQPYIVAFMTEILDLAPGDRVLEVGTGSGYQAAILAALGVDVFTIEIFEELAASAGERLARLGFTAVRGRHGDGHYGWIEESPFDAVIVTAAAGYIPRALTDQLRPGGRMVIPVGSVYGVQTLILVEKDERGELRTESLMPVRFVPMLEGLR